MKKRKVMGLPWNNTMKGWQLKCGLMIATQLMFVLFMSYKYKDIFPSDPSTLPPLPQELFTVQLSPHIYHDTLTLIPVNSGMLPILYNLMCSLANINPSLVSRLTIWAMDKNSSISLHQFNEKNKILSKNFNQSIIPLHGFGVFYDENYVGSSKYSFGGTEAYWQLMGIRKGYA
jgi:hypothetical protein